MRCHLLVLACLTIGTRSGAAQAGPSPGGTSEAAYYDFWIGTWYRVIDGAIDTAGTSFTVTRSVNSGALSEAWRMVSDSGKVATATALRAWDVSTSRWLYTWISDNGLYQAWDGRKVDGVWYIYRQFDINGDRYLSRQS